jgi:2-iminobutanoate/2-iminopropanoate deaminase
MSNFAKMNDVYAFYYPSEQPARAAFAVKELPLGVLVEIETIAVK